MYNNKNYKSHCSSINVSWKPWSPVGSNGIQTDQPIEQWNNFLQECFSYKIKSNVVLELVTNYFCTHKKNICFRCEANAANI